MCPAAFKATISNLMLLLLTNDIYLFCIYFSHVQNIFWIHQVLFIALPFLELTCGVTESAIRDEQRKHWNRLEKAVSALPQNLSGVYCRRLDKQPVSER